MKKSSSTNKIENIFEFSLSCFCTLALLLIGIMFNHIVPIVLGVLFALMDIYLFIIIFIYGENEYYIENDELIIKNKKKCYHINKEKIINVKHHYKIFDEKIYYLSFKYKNKLFIVEYNKMNDELIKYFSSFKKKNTKNFFIKLIYFFLR